MSTNNLRDSFAKREIRKVLIAAVLLSIAQSSLSLRTISLNMNSAIGDLHIFP